MGLFSRRKKNADTPDVEAEVPAEATSPDTVPAAAGSETQAEDPTPPDVPATMSISVSSYQGLGAQSPPVSAPLPEAAAPESAASAPRVSGLPDARIAPPPVETVAGLRDNVVLRDALAAVSRPPQAEEIINVARQLMQGHLFLRVKGDARALLAEGKPVPLGVASLNDKQYVLAYSSGAALRASVAADNESNTSAMGQPVLSVLRYVLDGPYEGLILDNSSAPARAVLPRDLLQKMLEQGDDSFELKTLLAAERTDATAPEVAEVLTRTKLWVAVNRSPEGRFGVAEARTTDGARLIELYSHPLEVSSMRRSDQPAPMTAAQVAAALRADDQLAGVIVDPAGPWIRLSRAELAPLIALAL